MAVYLATVRSTSFQNLARIVCRRPGSPSRPADIGRTLYHREFPYPPLSGPSTGGIAVAGTWAKAALPGALGNYANQLIQGIAGPLQSYIQNQQNKSSGK